MPLRLFLGLILAVLCIAPAHADEASDQMAGIARMSAPELTKFVDAVTATVGQDSLKMQAAAQRRDCLELLRTGNSFVLGYDYLSAARTSPAASGKDDAALSLRVRIVQGRVLAFAARMRSEDWLRGCAGFALPEAQKDDPHYRTPRPVVAADFADAVADAHDGALANLGAAAAALKQGDCARLASVGQAITLYSPYLEKLSADLGDRPQVLGPRVSRRLVDGDAAQLAAAEQSLWQQYSSTCQAPAGAGPQSPAAPPSGGPAPAGQ